MEGDSLLSPVSLPLPSFPPPPPPPPPPPTSFENRITPTILLIIVILAAIFFISGLLHLLVRCLLRPSHREPDAMTNVTALQGELQQLFHLHDSGVDQSFIDSLPVFQYNSIVGLKDPFDCAVCLCEFQSDDKLRLLPGCSHAFHLQCIDTWLLSHSTCPLCRRSLPTELSPASSCSPVVLVLESGGESSRENASNLPGQDDCVPSINDKQAAEAKVVPVKIGKLRSVDDGGGEGRESGSGSSSLDQRRCFSMGAYEYVMDESSSLRVTIKPSKKKTALKQRGHRAAVSECDCHSIIEGFTGFDASTSVASRAGGDASTSAGLRRKESYSVSKTWLRSRKDELVAEDDAPRRASSFRLPLHRGRDDFKQKSSSSPVPVTEDSDSWCLDVEARSCHSHVAAASMVDEAPAFASRGLLWIVRR
ncbi:hypothetical protein BHM03_00004205 [Ensete ventricosum]|uniref:RING-type E3 ubiquitin transferase n=1 Tax=Ensete ventricosum TaxID=4639 RepID=A0A445MAF3_ENSVE|nr:hypothetical protein BHM03_00004205 [Ensete ventricosum]